MKIVLSAFGDKLVGQPEDWPEETNYRIRLALIQPIQVFVSNVDTFNLMDRPLHTICTFEWTGKMEGNCRKYVLTKIE